MTSQPPFVNTDDIPISNPHNIVPVYSNNFAVTATRTDFTIFFLEVGQIPGPKGPTQRQEMKAAITLPMSAASGLREVMQRILQQAQEMNQHVEKIKSRGQ
jgi:hypothetical protein